MTKYYLVTNNRLSWHLVKSDRDLTEKEIDEYFGNKFYPDADEWPTFWVETMWWDDENPIVEL